MPWLALPEELILKALDYLDIRDLLALRLACHQLRTSIGASVELQCRLELAACGLREGLASRTVTSADRLQRIQAHDSAWRELPWTEVLQSEYPVSRRISNCIVTVSNNVVARQDSLDPLGTLSVKQLPSVLRGVETRFWEVHVNCCVDELTVDASQDLMIVSTRMTTPLYAIVRSLSTGDVHPECMWSGRINFPGLAVGETKLCGDFVGTNLYNPEILGHLSIWNWKTGVQLVYSMLSYTPVPSFEFPRFSFVDSSHILTMFCEQPDAPEVPAQLSLRLYDLSRVGADLELTGALVGSYALPQLASHGEPFFYENRSSPPASSSSEQGIFYPDRSKRLLGLGIQSDGDCFVVVFAPDIFLCDGPWTAGGHGTVPWDSWASSGVHFARVSEPRLRSFVMHGMRTVEYDEEVKELIISDYDAHRVRRAITASGTPEGGEAGTHSVIFEEETETGYGLIKTSLPRLVRRKAREIVLKRYVSRVDLCDDGVLLIEDGPHRIRTISLAL
ncbi:hypothetical protein FA95DRAFT_1604664 [Auriscalpium vulgare]|uniref:Uncharacterized protein n=1 Tax=Auriscalpium vulgare TaxID=40419 RepID=A0ACB8RZZ6_9AGAM|nr:hypothetical protein FA95DRAFT_1604664 [Auriscalpium vulgare]